MLRNYTLLYVYEIYEIRDKYRSYKNMKEKWQRIDFVRYR